MLQSQQESFCLKLLDKGGEFEMAEKVLKCGIKKEKGYLYFIDKKGDISRAQMARGRKKAKKKKKKK